MPVKLAFGKLNVVLMAAVLHSLRLFFCLFVSSVCGTDFQLNEQKRCRA